MTDIAVDSSTLIAWLYKQQGKDVDVLQEHIEQKSVFVPPPVISEALSYVGVTQEVIEKIKALPMLYIQEGYWRRAGENRRRILRHGLKAHLPDALIAQSCIDHEVPLLTRDPDFRHYAEHAGLKLAV